MNYVLAVCQEATGKHKKMECVVVWWILEGSGGFNLAASEQEGLQ